MISNLELRNLYFDIIQEPNDPILYLKLCVFYLDQNNSETAHRALVSVFRTINSNSDICDLLTGFSEDCMGRFLNILHDATRSVSYPAEVLGCLFLIQKVDHFLDQPSSTLSRFVFFRGYFKNLLGNYRDAKHLLEIGCQFFGHYQWLSRTLSESLLGSWDLDYNPHAGVDFSILKSFPEFSSIAQNSITPLVIERSHQSCNHSQAIVFLSCDGLYFERLGIVQALSLFETNPRIGIHFHVMNPQNRTIDWLNHLQQYFPQAEITYSLEQVSYGDIGSWERKTFYASARFCRAASFCLTTNKPVIITDADQIFRGSILNLIDTTKSGIDYDVALFDHQEAYPLISLYAKYGASFVVISATTLGRDYINQVGCLINHNLLRKACWTLDQISLLAIAKLHERHKTGMKMYTIPIHEITCEWDSSPASIWNSAGPCKFQSNTYTKTAQNLLRKWGFDDICKTYYADL
jgi:hypothetical protein